MYNKSVIDWFLGHQSAAVLFDPRTDLLPQSRNRSIIGPYKVAVVLEPSQNKMIVILENVCISYFVIDFLVNGADLENNQHHAREETLLPKIMDEEGLCLISNWVNWLIQT